MTQESGCPYEEVSIKFSSTRKSVLKRPGMYFGDLLDGSAYAGIIQDLVQATLSWRIGANLGMDLTRFNRHLIRSKLKRRASHEESQLHSRIQG